MVCEVAYSETVSHILDKVGWWFTFIEVRHVIVIWVRPDRYGSIGHHGVAPGERPVLVWHFARISLGGAAAAASAADPFHLVFPQGTQACVDCHEHYKQHIDIGSTWVVPTYGVHLLTIPSADLFHTAPNGVPVGFPVNVDIDLFFVREALENLGAAFIW